MLPTPLLTCFLFFFFFLKENICEEKLSQSHFPFLFYPVTLVDFILPSFKKKYFQAWRHERERETNIYFAKWYAGQYYLCLWANKLCTKRGDSAVVWGLLKNANAKPGNRHHHHCPEHWHPSTSQHTIFTLHTTSFAKILFSYLSLKSYFFFWIAQECKKMLQAHFPLDIPFTSCLEYKTAPHKKVYISFSYV